MYDTMTMTKLVGSLCGALLVFLLGKWAADELYATDGGHGASAQQAYVIEIEGAGAEGADGAEAEQLDLAALLATAAVDKGGRVFNKCRACHKLEDGANGVGPHLHGVVGRAVGTAEGFGYSGALTPVVDIWTPEALNAFLEAPKKYAPGTSMAFAGLKKLEDRVNLIAYLASLNE
ncbi:MAG: cytochrome c family protein [Rhodobacteraceae bacterium]|nr:cytochrome c family protein [Paracoccaceae bacterium]